MSAETMTHSVRHVFRTALRNPGFTLLVLGTLALGIGATTAIFTILDRVVLRPLPYAEAGQLVLIDSPTPGVAPDSRWGLSTAEFFYFKQHAHTLSDIGSFARQEVTVTGRGSAERVMAAGVSASLFNVLRLHATRGRLLAPSDNRPNAPPVAVLGYDYWQQHFGGKPSVIGAVVNIESAPTQIVGVLQRDATPPDVRDRVDLWLPEELDEYAPARNHHFLHVIGRLRPGATTAMAQTELEHFTTQFPTIFPSAYSPSFMQRSGFRTAVMPLRDHVVGELGQRLWMLLAAVALVLVIACANVANLFLVRAEGRRREIAIRSALGARQSDLVVQAMTETIILSLAAGGVACVLALAAIRVVCAAAPTDFPRIAEIHLGWASVAFALATSLGGGALFGTLVLATGGEAAHGKVVLHESGRSVTASRRQNLVRGALVSGQTALALVLLAAAALLIQSVRNLRHVSAGFDANGVLTAQVSLPGAKYDTPEQVEHFYHELLTRASAIPGVRAAGAGTFIPLDGKDGCSSVWAEGHVLGPSEQPPCVLVSNVTPGYFRTLGIALRGREPGWRDVEQRAGGVIVTRALAERLWPGQDPIGKGIKDVGNRTQPPWYHVVGVTGDLRANALDAPPTQELYLPMLPVPGQRLDVIPRSMTILLRSNGVRPSVLTAALRRALADVDPNVPLANVQTMDAAVAQSMARTTFTMLLLSIAAAMALALSAVGIYGVISYIVTRRRGEIGIRMAIGARASTVGGVVVWQSVRLAAIGAAAGIIGALMTARVLRSALFDVTPADPVTLGAAAITMLVIAVIASYVPAARAMRVDPVEALRAE